MGVEQPDPDGWGNYDPVPAYDGPTIGQMNALPAPEGGAMLNAFLMLSRQIAYLKGMIARTPDPAQVARLTAGLSLAEEVQRVIQPCMGVADHQLGREPQVAAISGYLEAIAALEGDELAPYGGPQAAEAVARACGVAHEAIDHAWQLERGPVPGGLPRRDSDRFGL